MLVDPDTAYWITLVLITNAQTAGVPGTVLRPAPAADQGINIFTTTVICLCLWFVGIACGRLLLSVRG